MLTTRYISLATTPITADDYAGPDVRYSSEFEEIEAALEKDGSIHANGGPDWQQVVTQSEQLLRSQSKDLRVACWLGWGLYRCEGINGLLAGVSLLNSLVQHWDLLHPLKPRTRTAAIGWLANRLEIAVPELLSSALGGTQYQQLHDQLTELDGHLVRLLGDQAPPLQLLCKPLHVRASDSQQVPPALTPAPSGPSGTSAAPPTAAGPSITAVPPESILCPRDAHKALRALQEQARSLCQWWQAQSIMDARAISLSRTTLWLPIEALPEHDDTGKTGLRGLPADRLKVLQERLNQHSPAELLRDVENSLSRAPFWLDGQYLAWRCLDELKAESAQREVEQQLRSFLRRLPGIENLQFFDGTPFADQTTLGWINATVLTQPGGGNLIHADQAPSDEPWDVALREASDLLRSDGLKAAMQPLQVGINRAQGGRAHLHWQLVTARLCLQAGKHELARNILEGLEQTLRDAQLTHWEPQLLVRVMRLLLKSHEQSGAKAARQRRDEIYQRLCHLDFDVVLEQALGP